jgi:hypothetical protein
MKIIPFICTFIISINSFGQTKQETIDWLNNKFSSDQFLIYSSDITSFSRHLKINNDGSFLITEYEKSNYANGTVKKYVTTYSGHFKDLSASSFEKKKITNYGKVSFASTNNTFLYLTCNGDKSIRQTNYKEGTIPSENFVTAVLTNSKTILIAVIPESADQSLIERSKKAFLHLINLCGGKKEVF